MLKFSPANAKTQWLRKSKGVAMYLGGSRKVYSLDLPAGHSCPGAKLCQSKAVPRTDDPSRFTIRDGRYCEFRCFSASQEVQHSATRNLRWFNFDMLRSMRGKDKCRELMYASLPLDCGVLRYHVAGDFFKLAYFQAALDLAIMRPDVLFYAYTKSLRYLLELPKMVDSINGVFLKNFLLTASRGGKDDHLINLLHIREAEVVFSEKQAGRLPIDHDDSHATTPGGSFALLIHGTQPAGSDAGKALSTLKGKGSYARK